ncbi:TetR/AcrR family transcriptional regulator [Orenia marismortui]|uniref:TetR family transcriptional regulator n=1 Tax=Orenia marismortui TaxID=46469 RepID=A0A4R8GUY7_9FIRM|nr:TetR/AcrR family transcriptional regulator [Orenia marismortui]TDX46481.1 TetR family transcriptional regulator [Orenia marismortui]
MEKNSKKERLIQAAIKLFAKQGYHNTTVAEIADEAGVAKGTVYWYFDSKEQLFWGIIVSGIELLNEKLLREAQISNKTAIEKLETIIRLHLDFFKESKNIVKMIQDSSVTPDKHFNKKIHKLRKESIDNLSKIIKEGQEGDEFVINIESEELANFILGSIGGSYNPSVYKLEDVEETTDLILKIMLSGIKA